MRLQSYLHEAYDYDQCDKYNDAIDRDICNWVRNEKRITWNSADRERCKNKYGNVKVGTVFRGIRIDSKDDYEMYKKIEKNGGVIDLYYASASPSESEAKSFAFYVKSYDEMTMMYMLKNAMESGSAGRYGSALLELEPAPDQVIFKNWADGYERKDWDRPPAAAEAEALLYGKVKVKKCKIYEKLNAENFETILDSMITSVDDLDNDFVNRWMRDRTNLKKIGGEEKLKKIAWKIFDKILKTDDDINTLFKSHASMFTPAELYNHPKIEKFVVKYMILDDTFKIVYKKDTHYIPNNDYYLEEFAHDSKIIKQIVDTLKPLELNVKLKSRTIYPVSLPAKYYDNESHYGPWMNLVKLSRINPAIMKKIKNHKHIKNFNNSFEPVLEYLTTQTIHDCLDHNNYEILQNTLIHLTNYCSWIFLFNPKGDKIRNSIVQHLYHNFAPRGSKVTRDMLSIVTTIQPLALKFGVKMETL